MTETDSKKGEAPKKPEGGARGLTFDTNLLVVIAAIVVIAGDSIREGFRQIGAGDPFRVGAVTLGAIYLVGLLVLLRAPETRGKPLMEDE